MNCKKKRVLRNNNNKKRTWIIYILYLINNILTKLFKELTKYKNDYQQYFNYIHRNYIIHFILYF